MGEATFFDVGRTACGGTYANTDYVAAVSVDYFRSAEQRSNTVCGRNVIVRDSMSGLNVIVRIVDVCHNCLYNDIALSRSAFEQLRSVAVGYFTVEWDFL